MSTVTPTIAERRARLHAARLYLVTAAAPGGRSLADVLGPALAGGVDVVQLRDKALDDEELLGAAATARRLCREAGALLILNDRPDLVDRAGADGAHVGQDDLPVGEARALAGPQALIGVSTHAPEQLAAAYEAGADYAGVGPVHATPTKPGRPAVGLAYVEHAAQAARLPWFAIGGIDETNVAAVVGAGAARVAVVRAIGEAADPEAVARTLRAAVERRALPGDGDGTA
ncbi:MAG: thiamine phosphate synthase [Solirubrobacteraceae bacterium]|nr:thiamine phosphate synthase [Solirubrobacteraceae bacterium]